jgi:hypothetical protein
MKVRKVNLNDRQEWARMRNLLWNSSKEEHLVEIDQYFANWTLGKEVKKSATILI